MNEDEAGGGDVDTDTTSLGRFAPDPTGAPLAEVRLLGMPVQVMMAAREHYDGLMREFRLLALDGHIAETDAPARLVELVRILGEQYGASRSRRDEILEAAVRRGDEVIDLTDMVPVTAAAAVDGLRGLMEEADRYCQEALLLTVPRAPIMKEYADWYFDEYARQLAGGEPTRWDGPLHV